jgi:hypothetical protein
MIDVVARLARVRDEELSGLAPPPELLASIVAEPVRRRAPRRRLVLAAATVLAATVLAVVGPSMVNGAATSYANSAIEVTREGDYFVARIKDPLANSARYVEAFQAVGKDVTIEFVPVSPRLVGQLLESTSTPNRTAEVSTELISAGTDQSVCETRPDSCTIVIRISSDTTATVGYTFGRAARPGESYQDPAEPPMVGDPAHGGGGK